MTTIIIILSRMTKLFWPPFSGFCTGDRTLIENSWRDDFWGWGPNRDGQNMLGKLWMEVRAELTPNA